MAGATRRLPLVLLAALALAACAGPSYVDRGGPEPGLVTRMVEPVVYEIGRQFARTPPSCIAILPFAVAVGEDGAWRRAKEVRRAVYAHLAPLPPRDVELAWIDRVVETMSAAARRNYALLGNRLGCDALLLGTLLESRERYLALYSEIVIGAELELVRASDGEVLWQARHIASSRGGALPVSPLGAVEGLVSAASTLLGEERERVTGDLARRLVHALPKAELFAAAERAEVALAGQ
jgi:hypothetical protein